MSNKVKHERQTKMKAKGATAASIAAFETECACAPLGTELPPTNVSANLIEMARGE